MLAAALAAALSGLLTGLSLIVAIGAQNAFVLRQGIRRSHVGPVVAVCAFSDLVLIAAGVLGVGALIGQSPWLLSVARWGGAAFLTAYAVRTLARSGHEVGLSPAGPTLESRRGVVARATALTWLNPHVYLDTVLLLGSVASSHPGRWWFAAGAGLGSVLWFSGLGFGARLLAPVLSSPRAWRVLDVLVAATMLVVAVRLALG